MRDVDNPGLDIALDRIEYYLLEYLHTQNISPFACTFSAHCVTIYFSFDEASRRSNVKLAVLLF